MVDVSGREWTEEGVPKKDKRRGCSGKRML